MRYLLLINKNEGAYRSLSDAERRDLFTRYEAYGRKMVAAGILKGGAMLDLTDTATTVRVRNGKRIVADGPFAETAEQIAGIAIIEVSNLDEALDWAAAHPDAEWASVEVRPIIPWEEKPR